MRKGTAVLDPSRPVGKVFGGTSPHSYVQDGKKFGPDGVELVDDGKPGAPDPAQPVSDPSAPENQPLNTLARTTLADRYHAVTGKGAPKGWNKTKLRDQILLALQS